MIARMIMLFRDYDIDTFFLQDGQSWPVILRTDREDILCDKSKKEEDYLKCMMKGTVVLENEEGGFWGNTDIIESGYPNPFLVKISRKMSEISDRILVCSAGMLIEYLKKDLFITSLLESYSGYSGKWCNSLL